MHYVARSGRSGLFLGGTPCMFDSLEVKVLTNLMEVKV
jgi:hypothetical protein